ncbi:protein CELLULOSE SYNTHASE INTERACTIVE 1-like [Canna indica]|uniref:Protein CELLULOSE SYNTHASE INTERACTIVE 1-like n=1 Tax=Canna indica TaxID=4628 RepID=A0AAQ3Q5G6_9LILI|nr:protein CELLULOSE SYNTHASE INTERACTIVE 1-like [Canna indica]
MCEKTTVSLHHHDASPSNSAFDATIVLPLPGPSASRAELAFFVCGLFARLQIGALDLKQKVQDSLLELLASDLAKLSRVTAEEGDLPYLLRLLHSSAISSSETARPPRSPSSPPPLTPPAALSLTRAPSARFSVSPNWSFDIQTQCKLSMMDYLANYCVSSPPRRFPSNSAFDATIVLPLPGPSASRAELAFFVRDLFVCLQIGALDLKQKVLDSLLELLAFDLAKLSRVAAEEGDLPYLLRLLNSSAISSFETARPPRSPSSPPPLTPPAALSLTRAPSSRFSISPNWSFDTQTQVLNWPFEIGLRTSNPDDVEVPSLNAMRIEEKEERRKRREGSRVACKGLWSA